MFNSPINELDSWSYTTADLDLPEALPYAGRSLKALSATTTTPRTVVCPVNGQVKVLSSTTPVLLEIQPLFTDFTISRDFRWGIPVLYLQFDGPLSGGAEAWEGAIFAAAGETFCANASSVQFGLAFSDRIARSIRQGSGEGLPDRLKTDNWNDLMSRAIAMERGILLLNAAGEYYPEPLNGTLTDAAGSVQMLTYEPERDRGFLRLDLTAAPLRLTPQFVSDDDSPADRQVLWVNVDADATVAASWGEVLITANTRSLTLVNIQQWLAPQYLARSPGALPRFTRGNLIVPLINGPEYFEDLFGEMNTLSAADTPFLFLTACEIDPTTELTAAGDNCIAAMNRIVEAGGTCHFLPFKFFLINPTGAIDTLNVVVFFTLLASSVGLGIGLAVTATDRNHTLKELFSVALPINGAALLGAMVVGTIMVRDGFIENFEFNRSALGPLNRSTGSGQSFCQYDPHPAIWADNPHLTTPDIDLLGIIRNVFTGVSVFHQKIAVLKKGNRYIGYCGGIDLSENRMDDATHRVASPYHDVQLRIEGPAVKDLAATFMERWNRRPENPASRIDPATIAGIGLSTVASPGAIAQVARTYFQPAVRSDRGLPYAPAGDRTILDTTLRALSQAREFIYIEDQYFTPPEEYLQALELVADRVKSLIVVIPGTPEQPFGHLKRNQIFQRLRDRGYENKLKVGFAQRQSLILPDDLNNGLGRLLLHRMETGHSENEVMVELSSSHRIPKPPFWLVINGQLFFIRRATSSSGPFNWERQRDPHATEGDPYFRFLASFEGTSIGSPGEPARGSAATVVRLDNIYIHSSVTIIDDVFASVGSAHVNRRSFYSDGEASVFMLPEHLKHAPDNLVRNLRKRLWGEMLNIPASIAEVVLDDPFRAAQYFDRLSFSGRFFTPLENRPHGILDGFSQLVNLNASTDFSSGWNIAGFLLSLAGATTLGVSDAVLADPVFDQVSDPSSFLEPTP